MNDLNLFNVYNDKLKTSLDKLNLDCVKLLAEAMHEAWQKGKRVFLCGNGGSAANSIHLANDYNYGISKNDGIGLRVIALPANTAVLTCLANDISYENIFSQQLLVQGEVDDVLIVLSGSGNSPNVVKTLEKAKELGLKTFAILGFSGGKCKELADVAIHIQIDDMQIAEDMQLVVGHMIMKYLSAHHVSKKLL